MRRRCALTVAAVLAIGLIAARWHAPEALAAEPPCQIEHRVVQRGGDDGVAGFTRRGPCVVAPAL